MTKQEAFITKTLLPYFTGEEAFSMDPEGECAYNGTNGTHCAFAKCVKHPENIEEQWSASHALRLKGFSVLTDEALGMEFSASEWNLIQNIHDSEGNSSRPINGLSKYGPFTKLRAAIEAYQETKK